MATTPKTTAPNVARDLTVAATATGTPPTTANVPRAGNRTLDDVTQMQFRNRQPAVAPSASTTAGSGAGVQSAVSGAHQSAATSAATTGNPAPAPNEATPAGSVAATETPPPAAASLANAAAAGQTPEVPVIVSETTNPAVPDATGALTSAATEAEGQDGGAHQSAATDDGTASPLLAEDGEAAREDALPTGADPLAAEIATALQGQNVPKAIQALTGRLGEVTRKLRETEARLHATERAQLEPSPGPETGARQSAATEQHPVLREIDGERAKVLNALEILERHPEGGALTHRNGQPLLNDKGQQFEYTPEQVRDLRFRYNERLRELGEDRMTARLSITHQHEQARTESIREARELYPWFWDKNSREYKVAANILREAPGLKQHPRVEIVLGRLVAGEIAEQDRRAGRSAAVLPRTAPPMKAPRSSGPPAPVVTTPAAAAPERMSTAQKQLQEAKGKQRTWKERANDFALERQTRTSVAA